MGQRPQDFAKLAPLVQFMTLTVVEHIHHILVGHSDRAPLIVTGREKLNHLPPTVLIVGDKKMLSLQIHYIENTL